MNLTILKAWLQAKFSTDERVRPWWSTPSSWPSSPSSVCLAITFLGETRVRVQRDR